MQVEQLNDVAERLVASCTRSPQLARPAIGLAIGKAMSARPGDFYVYAIFNAEGLAVYVGKGTGKRLSTHQRLGARHYNRRLGRALAGGQHVVEKVLDNLCEAAALELEASLIYWVGRVGRREGGSLLNLKGRRKRSQIKSRGFDTRLRRKFDGTVERR